MSRSQLGACSLSCQHSQCLFANRNLAGPWSDFPDISGIRSEKAEHNRVCKEFCPPQIHARQSNGACQPASAADSGIGDRQQPEAYLIGADQAHTSTDKGIGLQQADQLGILPFYAALELLQASSVCGCCPQTSIHHHGSPCVALLQRAQSNIKWPCDSRLALGMPCA